MTELLDASLRFPTVIFTIGLGIALVYWVFVLIGALDIDLFGADLGDIAGTGKGGAEALKGFKVDLHADGGFWEGLGLAAVPITISFGCSRVEIQNSRGGLEWFRSVGLAVLT